MESPRYRTTRVTHRGGIPYKAGVEIRVSGWPSNDVEPLNESAKRIMDWLGRFGRHPLKPVTPHNDLVGHLYLPGVLPNFGAPRVFNPIFDKPKNSTISPVRESEVVEGMPRYKSSQDQLLGKTSVPAGTEFCFLGWPLDSFTATNKPANEVKAYHVENYDNPALLPSPWCHYAQAVVLPTLPPVKDEKKERKRERAEARKKFEAMGIDVREVR
jgi:hypothetical protein